jgi:hypothetical protein
MTIWPRLVGDLVYLAAKVTRVRYLLSYIGRRRDITIDRLSVVGTKVVIISFLTELNLTLEQVP